MEINFIQMLKLFIKDIDHVVSTPCKNKSRTMGINGINSVSVWIRCITLIIVLPFLKLSFHCTAKDFVSKVSNTSDNIIHLLFLFIIFTSKESLLALNILVFEMPVSKMFWTNCHKIGVILKLNRCDYLFATFRVGD